MGLLPEVIEIETVGGESGFTVITIMLLVTVGEETHVSLVVKMQVTASVFCRFDVVKVELFVPTLTPFIRH